MMSGRKVSRSTWSCFFQFALIITCILNVSRMRLLFQCPNELIQREDDRDINSNVRGSHFAHRNSSQHKRLTTSSHFKSTLNHPDAINVDIVPNSFARYLRWHNQMRSCLQNNSCPPSSSPTMLLWRCPQSVCFSRATIQDRLHGILSAFTIALLTHKIFLLDLPSDENPIFPFEHVVSPSLIDWRVPTGRFQFSEWPVLDVTSHLPKWKKCPTFYSCDRRDRLKRDVHYINRNVNLFEEATLNIMRDSMGDFIVHSHSNLHSFPTLSSLLMSEEAWRKKFPDFNTNVLSEFQLQTFLFQSLFKPSPLTRSILRRLIPDHAASFDDGYVAVHANNIGQDSVYIRRSNGNRIRSKRLKKKMTKLERTEDIAQRLMICAGLNGLKQGGYVYFSSDSATLTVAFVKIAAATGVHVMYSNVDSLQIAKWKRENEHVKFDARKLSVSKAFHKFLNDFIDLFAFARAKAIVSIKPQSVGLPYLIGSTKVRRVFNVSNGTDRLLDCL